MKYLKIFFYLLPVLISGNTNSDLSLKKFLSGYDLVL